jgi:hypothetical protein
VRGELSSGQADLSGTSRKERSHGEASPVVVREEFRRLGTWGERHRRLLARLVIALALTVVVDASGAVLVWLVERHAKGTDVHTYGDALFFSTVQVLTVSSSLKNPLTTTGRVVDVLMEVWAVFVITAVAGSFASFFHTGDAAG